MPDVLTTFLAWYLAPWRRLDRKGFGVALLVVSLPSLLGIFTMAEGAGGFIGPMMDIVMAIKGLSAGGDAMGALETAQHAMSGMTGGEAAGGISWFALLNNLLLLGLFPLCRMRLRDMGYAGRQELGWALAMNVSVLDSLIKTVVGSGVLPLGWLWVLVNFGGYIWLSMAAGKPQLAVHERMDYSLADKPASPYKDKDDE